MITGHVVLWVRVGVLQVCEVSYWMCFYGLMCVCALGTACSQSVCVYMSVMLT